MWISRVEEIDAQRDSVQVTNPFMMQNNTNSLRSPMTMNNNVARKVNAVAAVPNDIGVVVSLSGRRGETVNQATTLSGIDVNLFAAD